MVEFPPRPALCGVCAHLAERSGVPVTGIRIAAVLLLFWHPALIGPAYLAGAFALRRSERVAAPRAPWSDAIDRFERLNRRASRMGDDAWRRSWR